MNTYVNFGCGLIAPNFFINYDASPTLRLQKIPLIGTLIRSASSTVFPSNVLYGNIVKGLPLSSDSCNGIYCSHVLEHLALNEFRVALKNIYTVLKKGSYFRFVVPDLNFFINKYIQDTSLGNYSAAINFCKDTMFGVKDRNYSLAELMSNFFGHSNHLWMWDFKSLEQELKNCGFLEIKKVGYNETEDENFLIVEQEYSFEHGLGIECKK